MRGLLTPFLSAIVVFIGILGAETAARPEPEPEPDENDAKRIVGTWEVIKASEGGKPKPEQEVKGMTMKFDKDTILIQMGNGTSEKPVSYKLNSKTKPRSLDIALGEKAGNKTIPAIYKFEKEELTICFHPYPPVSVRPKSFDEKGYSVIKMRKAKAKEKK